MFSFSIDYRGAYIVASYCAIVNVYSTLSLAGGRGYDENERMNHSTLMCVLYDTAGEAEQETPYHTTCFHSKGEGLCQLYTNEILISSPTLTPFALFSRTRKSKKLHYPLPLVLFFQNHGHPFLPPSPTKTIRYDTMHG